MNIDVGRRAVTVGVDGSERALQAVRWGRPKRRVAAPRYGS